MAGDGRGDAFAGRHRDGRPHPTATVRRVFRLPLTMLALVALLAGPGSAGADAAAQSGAPPVIHLASLEWPPYSSADLPGQGASIAVVRAALATQDHRLEVEFLSWTEAVAQGLDGSGRFHGYLPAYPAPHVKQAHLLTQAIGESPLGFVERRSAPLTWTRLEDLRGQRIGVVRGYANGVAFDQAVARGLLDVAPADSDARNIRLVTRGELPLAVIDRRVLGHLISASRRLGDARHVVQFNARPLDTLTLHVVLRRTDEGERIRRLIDRGLRRIDIEAIQAAHFAKP